MIMFTSSHRHEHQRVVELTTIRNNQRFSSSCCFYVNDVLINDDVIELFQNHHGLLSLEVNDVKREDAGLYSVRAANLEGEVTCSASLDVQGKK